MIRQARLFGNLTGWPAAETKVKNIMASVYLGSNLGDIFPKPSIGRATCLPIYVMLDAIAPAQAPEPGKVCRNSKAGVVKMLLMSQEGF